MSEPRILRFYLEQGLRRSAVSGRHNFIGKIAAVAAAAGYRIEYCGNTASERAKSAHRRGCAMFHMEAPAHDRALTFRQVYHYPFWAIESSARRWEWRVARTPFTPGETPRKEVRRFYRFWQQRLFADAPDATSRDGYVYVPLQGRLAACRSFQACSPLEMLTQVLQYDPGHRIIATLHPNESYSNSDRAALNRLTGENSRLSLQTGDMVPMLQGCDYVVTQNSGAAFAGYFFGKPCALFGRIDFHHIAANVHRLGVREALARAPELAPDYAGYLHWFWQEMSINAGRSTAEDRIRAAMIRAGWPM
jgi:hypothetical protein